MKKVPPRACTIMNTRPVVLTQDSLISEASAQMWRKQVPAAVVVDGENRPVGILSQQGLMLALLDVVNHEMPAGPVMDYLDPGSPAIDEKTTLLQMAEVFARRGYSVRGVAVVRNEKLVGLVVRRDVVHGVMDYLSSAGDKGQLLYLSALKDNEEPPSFE